MGRTVISVPPLLGAFKQVALREMGGMAAGRLGRDAGDISKLRRGKCAAVQEGGQDVRTRRIADQRRNPGQMDAVCHATTLLPSRPVSTAEHFGRNRNVGTGLRSESYPD